LVSELKTDISITKEEKKVTINIEINHFSSLNNKLSTISPSGTDRTPRLTPSLQVEEKETIFLADKLL